MMIRKAKYLLLETLSVSTEIVNMEWSICSNLISRYHLSKILSRKVRIHSQKA